MNGWMRLWVALSMVWITLLGGFCLSLPWGTITTEDVVSRANFWGTANLSNDERESLQTFIITDDKTGAEFQLRAKTEEAVRPLMENTYKEMVAEYNEARLNWLGLILIPPLVLLALGHVTAWIRRGFTS